MASISWLTDENSAFIFAAFAVVCFFFDVRTVRRSFSLSKASPVTSSPEPEDENTAMRNRLKSDPKSMFNISTMLEKDWGRKPTFDELTAYVDQLEIADDALSHLCD